MAGDARRWKADLRPPREPDIGDKIGDYKLEKKLGQGATGAVHKAYALRGPLRGKVIAIKIIQKTSLNSDKRKRRVDCEIALHKELARHPAIVRFEHSFEDVEAIYIITEYCPGSTLFKYTQDNHPTGLPENEVRPIFLALVQAVAFLHLNGILHRDLKLTNVLLTETMQVRIADFGLATKLADATLDQEMTMCGTPNYISPEIVKRFPYGVASDVWSLGCMLVALTTGRPPFQGDQISETLHLVSKGAYRPLPRSSSRDVKNLVESILQTDPQRRPTTSEILAHPFLAAGHLPATKSSSKSDIFAHGYSAIESRAFVKTRSESSPRVGKHKIRQIDGRNQGHQPGRTHVTARSQESSFDFGESVSDKVQNPWSRTQPTGYRDLVRELRSDVRNQQKDWYEEARVVHARHDSQISQHCYPEATLDSRSAYQKHRQDVPPRAGTNPVQYQQDHRPMDFLSSRGFQPYDHLSKWNHDQQVQGLAEPAPYRHMHSRQTSDPAHTRPRSSQLYRRSSWGNENIQTHAPQRVDRDAVQPVLGALAGMQRLHLSERSSKTEAEDEFTARPAKIWPDAIIDCTPGQKSAILTQCPKASQTIEGELNDPGIVAAKAPKATRFSRHAEYIKPVSQSTTTDMTDIVGSIITKEDAAQGLNKRCKDSTLVQGTDSLNSKSDDPIIRLKFSTADLKAVAQENKHGQIEILDSGQVFVLLKKDGRQHLISPDGNTITTTDKNGVQKSFSLEDLPARSLLAYRYASKFVNLARSKTVRIALDSGLAKCRLYQNETFEVVLLKHKKKVSFEPMARIIKIADHDAVLWKGLLDQVASEHRELVRHALIWWARCKDALDEPIPDTELQSSNESMMAEGSKAGAEVKFVDGLGWCEKLNNGKTWTMYFLDGLSMELSTVARTIRVVHPDESTEEHRLEAGLPLDIRQRLKSVSRAMKQFV